MKLTEQQIHSAGTCGIGFNFHQLYVLGVPWPPKHGWIQRLAGQEIDPERWELVVRLKGKRRRDRRDILSQTRFNDVVFMRKCDYKDRVVELEEENSKLVEYITKHLGTKGEHSVFETIDNVKAKLSQLKGCDHEWQEVHGFGKLIQCWKCFTLKPSLTTKATDEHQ